MTILESTSISFDVANTNESCNGTNDATITVSNILGGLPTQTATVTVDGLAPAATYAPGLHTIRVSFPDGNNVSTCYLEKTVTILEPAAVSFDVANTNESCNGTNDATITVSNILGGLPTQTATVTVDGLAPAATYAPGLHTIRVSFPDGNNVSTCYLEKTVTILEPVAVSFDVANTNESCNGTNDATITVSNILGGLPTQTATVTVDGLAPAATYAPGLHTIRVSFPDGNNVSTCYLEKTVTILEPAAVSFDVANTNESCNGTNDATITVSNILGGLPTQTATVTVDGLAPAATYAPGLHTIRVSFPDGNNVSTCYLEKTVTILEPAAVSFDVANTNESCNGTNDATITVSNILGGLPTQTATVTVDGLAPAATYAPGLHTIRVSFPDGNNVSTCYLEKTVTILEPVAVSFDVANTNESCNGTNDATITVSNILGGLPTQTATVTVDGLAPAATYAPGLHTIRVSFPDGNNVSTCYLEKTVTILEPAAVSFDVANTNESCNGTNDATITVSNILGGLPTQTATVTVDGLAPALTYAPGLHTIRVSFPDGNNVSTCYLEKTVTILEPAAVSFDVANTNESCNGTNDATITVSNILGGLPTQTATVTVDGLAPAATYAPGLHTIRVSFPDGNNVSTCYLEKTVTILEPAAVSFDVANTNESCNGTNDATITVSNILGGLPTQTATVTVDGLAPAATYAPGLHTIRVSFPDGNNVSTCYLEKTVTILEPAAVSFDVANTNESCNGTNDATITVSNILGGLPTQTATVTVDGLAPAATYAPGLHIIRVSFPDGNNVSTCYLEKTVTITEPAALVLDASSETDVSCFSGSDGSVTAGTVSNAVGTVNYTWTNASNAVVGTTATVNGLPIGVYTLTVTDNCFTLTNSVTISYVNNAAPVINNCPSSDITVNTDPTLCQHKAVGSEFDVTATSNCPLTYTYSLSGATTGTGSNTLSGIIFGKGTTQVSWTVSDGLKQSTCTFNVIVNDNEAPQIISIPADITVSCAGLVPVANDGDVIATDNCSGYITITHNDVVTPGTCANRFSIARTYTATDPDGNSFINDSNYNG